MAARSDGINLASAYSWYTKLVAAGTAGHNPDHFRRVMSEQPPEIELLTAINLMTSINAAEEASMSLYGRSVKDEFLLFYWTGEREVDLRQAKRVTHIPTRSIRFPPGGGYRDVSALDGLVGLWRDIMVAAKAEPVPKVGGPCGDMNVWVGIVARSMCLQCGISGDIKLKHCTCGATYCSKECQTSHWPLHKKLEHAKV